MQIKFSPKKIKLVDLLYAISLVCLFYGLFFSSLSSKIISNNMIRILIPMVGMGVILLQFRKFKFYSLPYYVYLIIIAMAIIILIGWLKLDKFTLHLEYTIRYLCILVSLFFMSNDKRWISIFLKLLYVFSIFYTLTTIWLYFDTNSYFKYFADNLYPNNVNYNFYGGYLKGYTAGVTDHYSTNGMMLANAIICFFGFAISKKDNRKLSIVSIIFLVLSIIAMILTGKRAHLLFSMVAILCGLIIFLSKDKSKGIKFICLFMLLAIVVVIAVNTSERLQNVLSRFENMSEDGNITSRFEFWEKGMELFNENKLTGIGWMHFYLESGFEQSCHNCYVQILCETGIVGAIIFIPFFIFSFIVSLKLLLWSATNKRNVNRYIVIFSIFSFCYQIYFLLYCLTGNPLFDIYCYGPYFVGTIISISLYKEYVKVNNNSYIFSKLRLY